MAAALSISGPSFNPFGRAWAAYERSLRRRPVLTQAVSSALLWGLGDAMAQRIESRGQGGIDARRVAMTGAFGGAVIGPAGHGWYMMLEKLVLQLGLACSMKSMLLKVTIDNLLYSPLYVLAFFAYGCMVVDGLSPAACAEKLREEFVPTMLAEAMIWPPYMAAVFSRVPVTHQLLAVNVATLFDVCFLSWMRTRDSEVEADSHERKEQPVAQQQSKQQQHSRNAKLSGTSKGVQEAAQLARMVQQQQQRVATGDRDDVHAVAMSPWDAVSDENLCRMTLMAASATCSTAGSDFFGLRLSRTPTTPTTDTPSSASPAC